MQLLLATFDQSRVSKQDALEFKQWKAWEVEEVPIDDYTLSIRTLGLDEKRTPWLLVEKTTTATETTWWIRDHKTNKLTAMITTGKAYL